MIRDTPTGKPAEPEANTGTGTAPQDAGCGRTGIWLIGARGSVATTAVIGLAAIASGVAKPQGCVTAQACFDGVPLPDFADLVVGGHDISGVSMPKRAERLADAGMLPGDLLASVQAQLEEAESRVRPGYDPDGAPEPQGDAARRLAGDILAFKGSNGLRRVIVLDVASTEAPPVPLEEHSDAARLAEALADPGRPVLPASSVAAYAAVLSGSPYICFTPSASLNIPALYELAGADRVPTAGQDGKTGQTWLRSVLAPALSARGLQVLSWAGTNLLGGGDGATLADSRAVSGKLLSKNRGLRELTGGAVTPLHIDNVPDLGETKVAWDHIHAEGFLGSRLTLQTTWTAYDSMLAAPMVLDLARLMALADAAGETGPVAALGFFFKDPWGSADHSFARQTENLLQWAHAAGARIASAARDGQQ